MFNCPIDYPNKTCYTTLKEYFMETKNIEYKIKLDKDNWIRWMKTLCGFSNTAGGHLLIGYNDAGVFVGMTSKEADETVRYLNEMVRRHTSPIVKYNIDFIQKDEKVCVDINVSARQNAITWLVDSQTSPQAYIRADGETVLATVEEMQSLLLKANAYEYDKTPIGIKYSDVSFEDLQEEYRKNNNNESITLKMLKSFELVTADDYLTIAGYMFSDNSDYKNMRVVCTTWPSNDKGTNSYLDSKSYSGSAVALIKNILEYIQNVSHYRFGGIKDKMYRKDNGSFDILSLREAIVNAIAHRDYKIDGNELAINCYPNRIEISSPGSMLQEEKTVLNAKLASVVSVRRNKVICDMFVRCKLMEEKGSGFEKILKDYERYDENYHPLYSANRVNFTLVLKNKKYEYGTTVPTTALIDYPNTSMFKCREVLYKENNKYQEIEDLIKEYPDITSLQLAEKLSLSKEGIKYYIAKMKEANLVRREGSNVSGRYILVNDEDRPADFNNLEIDIKSQIITWCKTHFIKTETFNLKHTSYGLKHILQRQDGTYLTNGQFKAAMLLAGFSCKDNSALNWCFDISENSAALKLNV